MVIALVSFVAVVALIFGTYWLCVMQPESSEHRALRPRTGGSAGVVNGIHHRPNRLVGFPALDRKHTLADCGQHYLGRQNFGRQM